MTEPAQPPVRFSKEHRRQERARVMRLGRLPGPFLAFADRGRGPALLVNLLQAALVVALTLLVAKALTGDWLPRYVAVVALGVSVAVTAVNRRVNSNAEKA